jgi:hypothetical protein
MKTQPLNPFQPNPLAGQLKKSVFGQQVAMTSNFDDFCSCVCFLFLINTNDTCVRA